MTHGYLGGSDMSYSDASFVRLKSLVISYFLNKKKCQRLRLDKVQFFLEAQNLFTVTSFIGNDPETGADATPQLRTILAGIKISL